MPQAVTAVIVNYNTRQLVLSCIESVQAEGVDDVIVVDNGSSDGSAAAIRDSAPSVVVVEEDNRGFGSGVNAGVRAAKGDYLLVMNADVVLQPGAVTSLIGALDREPKWAAVGPRVENPDGTLYPSARVFPSLADAIGHGFLGLVAPNNAFSRRYKLLDWDHEKSREVDWLSGACFLIRRAAFDAVAGFDESYFMYMEDVDLCWRLAQRDWRVGYEPQAIVRHEQGSSADQHPYRMIAEHHRSLLRFSWRTATPRRRLVYPAVVAGLSTRAVLAMSHRALVGKRPGHGNVSD